MGVELHPAELAVIEVALRGDIDLRRYAPEVASICQKLGLPEPAWMDEESVRERLGRSIG